MYPGLDISTKALVTILVLAFIGLVNVAYGVIQICVHFRLVWH